MVPEDVEDAMERRRVSTGSVSARLMRASEDPDFLERAGSSTIEGFPEKMTETTRAVMAMLYPPCFLCSSVSESRSKSEKSSAEEDASSSEER
jgi:hypothetical protein